MSDVVKRMIEAQKAFASSKADLRGVVSAKIKKDYKGYELPSSVCIEITSDGKVKVSWRDLDAINYGLYPDEDDFVDLIISPEEL